jgi:hypothetical protein
MRFNVHPVESICVGMVMIDDKDHATIRLSDIKMKMAKKIIKGYGFKLFKHSVDAMVKSQNLITLKKLNRLHVYQNGILMVSEPIAIDLDGIEDDYFDKMFFKRIEEKFQ